MNLDQSASTFIRWANNLKRGFCKFCNIVCLQEVSDAMAKQIVANNGELPSSVALSVAVKPIPNVGAKNIRSLPRGVGACAAQRARGSASAKQSTGAEYDGVSGALNVQLMNFRIIFPQYIGIGCNCKRWGSDHFLLEC